MYQKRTGIILKKFPLGEADELLTIYTKEEGKLRTKVKSVRKLKSRLAGHLQTLNEVEFETASRNSQNSIPVLISVRILNLNSYLRENLPKFSLAQVAGETLYRLTPEAEQNKQLYDLLSDFLKRLGKNKTSNKVLLRKFQIDLLKASGYMFPLKTCIDSQKDLSDSDAVYFSSRLGGLLHPDAREEDRNSIRLGPEEYDKLARLVEGRDIDLTEGIEKAVDGFLRYVLEREIKSEKFVNSLGKS